MKRFSTLRRAVALGLVALLLLLLAACGLSASTVAPSNSVSATTTQEEIELSALPNVAEEATLPVSSEKLLDSQPTNAPPQQETSSSSIAPAEESKPDETDVVYGQDYSSAEAVAAYLHRYQELPPNFITKSEATDLGWVSSKGNLWEVMPECSIGGDRFSNREGLLPKAKGRQYYECDINYHGGYRGAERLIYSNDGLIYYTNDHYKTFTLLYGEEILK